MDRIKFFAFVSPTEDEVQNELDEWIEQENPVIVKIKQTGLVNSKYIDRYFYMTIHYRREPRVGLNIN